MNNLLPQIQTPVDSKDLENQISSQYGVSSEIASIIVELLMLYPEYRAKIKSDQQPNQNQNQNQQNQNNESMLTSQKLKPTSQGIQQQTPNTETSTPASTTSSTPTEQQQNSKNADLGKTEFANYRSMNHCLSD